MIYNCWLPLYIGIHGILDWVEGSDYILEPYIKGREDIILSQLFERLHF